MKLLLPWLVPAAVVLALAAAGDEVRQVLRYERRAVLDGELWRLLSAHWVHLSPVHAVLNLLGLYLMQAAVGEWRRWYSALGALLACELGVALGLLTFSPRVDWYVGLSGALHGHILALVFLQRPLSPLLAVLVPLGVAVKIAWEMLSGPAPGLESLVGGPVLPASHLYGGVSGVIVAAVLFRGRRRHAG